MAKMAGVLNQMMAEKVTFRDRAAVSGFFDGLDLAEPSWVMAGAVFLPRGISFY